MTLRCPKCNNRMTEKACTFCPDPAQRLMALQSRAQAKPIKPKRTPQGRWWMSQWKKSDALPVTKPLSGQDAATRPI